MQFSTPLLWRFRVLEFDRLVRSGGHGFVQGQFAGQLVSRRKLYPPELRDALPRLAELRERADYGLTQVSQPQAVRAVRRAHEFIEAIQRGGEKL